MLYSNPLAHTAMRLNHLYIARRETYRGTHFAFPSTGVYSIAPKLSETLINCTSVSSLLARISFDWLSRVQHAVVAQFITTNFGSQQHYSALSVPNHAASGPKDCYICSLYRMEAGYQQGFHMSLAAWY